MPDPLVLYSANTLLAYRINEHFYGQSHFVWCSSFFSANSTLAIDVQMPPSSTPCDICRNYLEDVYRQDWHSSRIKGNQVGIKKGMRAKRNKGELTPEQYRDVRDLVQPVPRYERAHPFSPEYKIQDLPRSRFDVLEWSWR